MFLILLFTLPQHDLRPPGLTTQVLVGQGRVREHRLWMRTLVRYTRPSLPEICGKENVGAIA